MMSPYTHSASMRNGEHARQASRNLIRTWQVGIASTKHQRKSQHVAGFS
jgi:hypothetical protein